jgi:YVTN family beta-propeller protein
MTYHTTGSTCSPAGQTRTSSRTAGALVVGLAALAAAALGRPAAAPAADQNTVGALLCGAPLARQLASGATDSFNVSLLPGTVVSTDVIATVNLGLLKLQSVNFTPATETCSGDLVLSVPQPTPPATDVGPGTINVTDCLDNAARGYTISLSVVSQGPDNCGVALPCGTPLNATFGVSGEVDPYTFSGVDGDHVTLAVTDITPAIGQVRLRLFGPSGALLHDGIEDNPTCPGSLQMQLPSSGTYTLLVSSCTGPKQGQYTVTWQPASCAPKALPGQFAYVTNADSGTMTVVDLSSNTAQLIAPITPPGRAEVASSTFVAITPNGGFAWATYETASITSVFNTSTNLPMASVPSGLEADGVTISSDGSTAYIVSNSLGGIELVDTKTNRVTRVVAQDIGFSQGIATATNQDGTFLYVVSEDAQGLVKINTVDYRTEAVTPLDLGFYDAFAVSPDGTVVYAGELNDIAIIDTTTNAVVDTIPTGEPFAIAFTADGRAAYATIADDARVAVIDTARHRQIDSINDVGEAPGGIAIAPDSGLAYVTDFTAGPNDPGIFVIDTTTNQVIDSLPTLGAGPTGIALTTAPTGLCVGDAQGETKVTVDELVLSVNYLLNGCPGRFPSASVPFP